jgi:hypothetical protein
MAECEKYLYNIRKISHIYGVERLRLNNGSME